MDMSEVNGRRGVLAGMRSLVSSDSSYQQVSLQDDVEAGQSRPIMPSRYNVQAHLLNFDAEVDYDDEMDSPLLDYSQGEGRKSFTRTLNHSCFCFGVPCGIVGTLVFSLIVVFLFASVTAPIKNVVDTNALETSAKAPEFATSLGCQNSPFFYKNTTTVSHAVPIAASRDLLFKIRGGAVGSVTIVAEDASESGVGADKKQDTATIELSIQTDDQALLDALLVEQKDPESTPGHGLEKPSFWRLNTPFPSVESCMRYDIVLRVPAGLERLHVVTHSLSHIRFASPDSDSDSASPAVGNNPSTVPLPRLLSSLFVTFKSANSENLLIPSSTALGAYGRTGIQMAGGSIHGSLLLGESVRLVTQGGSAQMDLDVVQLPSLPSDIEDDDVSALRTITGSGAATLRVVRPSISTSSEEQTYRPITADHLSTSASSVLHLDYAHASMNGPLDFSKSPSGSINGVEFSEDEGDGGRPTSNGRVDGKDSVRVVSTSKLGRVELEI